jgi:hypothetical protein
MTRLLLTIDMPNIKLACAAIFNVTQIVNAEIISKISIDYLSRMSQPSHLVILFNGEMAL